METAITIFEILIMIVLILVIVKQQSKIERLKGIVDHLAFEKSKDAQYIDGLWKQIFDEAEKETKEEPKYKHTCEFNIEEINKKYDELIGEKVKDIATKQILHLLDWADEIIKKKQESEKPKEKFDIHNCRITDIGLKIDDKLFTGNIYYKDGFAKSLKEETE